MAEIVWTEPALQDLDTIAEYIALDNPEAAGNLVIDIFATVERLAEYPKSGKTIRELRRSPCREIVVSPCRIFYRPEKAHVYLLHVIRTEKLFRKFLLKERNRKRKKFQP